MWQSINLIQVDAWNLSDTSKKLLLKYIIETKSLFKWTGWIDLIMFGTKLAYKNKLNLTKLKVKND